MRSHLKQTMKVHHLLQNESKLEQVHTLKNYFSSSGCTQASSVQSTTVDTIIPSLSENDCGNLAFKNTTWKQNPRRQFDTLSFSPPIVMKRCGLFGNLELDVEHETRRHLNTMIYHTQGTKHFIVHEKL